MSVSAGNSSPHFATDIQDVLAALANHYQGFAPPHQRWPNYKGEYLVLCPFHDDRTIGSFSFGERGYKCFSCGAHGSLGHLARHVLGVDPGPLPVPRARPRPDRPRWLDRIDVLRDFRPLPDDVRAYLHRRGMTDPTIDRHLLGFGVLPHSQCDHPRIILPLFEEGRLVGLKGRQFGDCPHPKWLQGAGSRTILFGMEDLKAARDRAILLTEAPFSAILASQDEPGRVALAPSSGADAWRGEWADAIKEAGPAMVDVWFDNDPGGARAGRRAALALAATGVATYQFAWPPGSPAKCDLADYRKSHSIAHAMVAHGERVAAPPAVGP